EGQCSEMKGPGKGRSPAAALTPRRGPRHEGQRLPLAASRVNRPGILAKWPSVCGSRPDRGGAQYLNLPGTTRTPACMHGEETGLLRRGTFDILTAAVMRLHSHQVCLITRRQTWLFQRPSSLRTPIPVGSLAKGGDYRTG
ncbi:hypothetical protein M9458_029817, partial [Cirrhinus mrigala]